MSRFDDLVQRLCPAGVRHPFVGEAMYVVATAKGVQRNAFADGTQFPIIDQGQRMIAGYTDDESILVPNGEYVIFGDHTRVVKWVDFHFAPGADGTKVLKAAEGIVPKYAYYAIANLNIPSRGYNRHWTVLRGLVIPVPPVEVQREVVRVLDLFTTLKAGLEAELDAELKARRTQYAYYRDEVLTFPSDGGVPWLALGSVCKVFDGTHQTPTYTDQGVKFVSVENIGAIYDTKKCISQEDFDRLYKNRPRVGDVFMTRIGSIGSCAVVERGEPLAFYVSLALIRPDLSRVNSRYLRHVLESGVGVRELRKRTLVNAVPVKINLGDVGKLTLPIPPLAEQERIAGLLDKFDAQVNDLSSGLPAELVARRKQYEYYRDRLLTFKELSA